MANSLVYWTQDLVRAGMLERGGRIFAMTSAGDHVVWKAYGAVSAAKSVLESHIRQLAVELAPAGIRRTRSRRASPTRRRCARSWQHRDRRERRGANCRAAHHARGRRELSRRAVRPGNALADRKRAQRRRW
ncbi:MAG: SDR family oxidoreductase [Thermoanaerobaculia bacterium]